ncbi:hypothetical protein KKF03_00770, partial [Patescibacteria group bacterium]|nr:hypothetical protein [Patescibacteria group bacterium]
GFFEPMSVDDCENRLNDPDHWVVTRAGGKILDPRSVEWRDFRYVAGMQVQLPSDDPRAPLVTKIPDPEKDGKAFYEGRNRQSALTVAKKIHENHAIAGCIDEVGVWPPEYRRKGLASMARQASFRHIREVINPTRKNAIRVLVANMFNIRGMVVRNPEMQKPRAMLKNDKGKVESVRNQPSIDMHAFSTKIKSIITWNIAKDTIPVLFDYEGESVSAELLVGWDTVVMKV